MNVQNEMTKDFVTIGSSDSLETAYRVMSLNRIRHLPVVNEEKEVCGIISDRDIQRGMTSDTNVAFGLKLESLSFRPDARVGDYMSWPAKTVDAKADLKEAAQLMLDNKVSALLVTQDQDKDVVGIVTTDDMLRAIIRMDEDNSKLKLNDFLTPRFLGRLAQMASDAGI